MCFIDVFCDFAVISTGVSYLVKDRNVIQQNLQNINKHQ